MGDPGNMRDGAVEKKEERDKDDSSMVMPISLAKHPCFICLYSRINKSRVDGCDHTFCYSCIVRWLAVSAVCPLCRNPVTEVKAIIYGKSIVRKMHEIKAEGEMTRIIAQSNEVPMTSEIEAVTQLIYQQRADVQRMMMSKSMNMNDKTLNERCRDERSKLTQLIALRAEMDRLSRRDIMGDMRFRDVVYTLQLVWKEISHPLTAMKFNPSMACSDPDGLMQRLRPFLIRELKIVMIDKRRLSDQVLSKVLNGIQNYNINNPNFEMVLFNTGMFNPRYLGPFAYLLHEFCASGMELKAFDANSTYSLNPERAGPGRLIHSLLPGSSRTSDPITINDDNEDKNDEPEVLNHFNARNKTNSYITSKGRGLAHVSIFLPAKMAPGAHVSKSIPYANESNTRRDEARMNSTGTRDREPSTRGDRNSWNTNREIGTSWRTENERKAEERRDKRGTDENERRKDNTFMGVRNGSRKNNTQHYYDKLHYDKMSAEDLEKLSGELSSFKSRIMQLKNICDGRVSEMKRSEEATSSNRPNRGNAVVDVDDDIIID